jgi:hypothetical protein
VWSWGEAAGVPSDFSDGFSTGNFQMISRKDENTSKNHILKILLQKY